MKTYVLMLVADPDDQLITEETLSELSIDARVEFLPAFDLLESFINVNGQPLLMIINEGVGDSAMTILKKIKANSLYSYLPCIVLTERSMQEDILRYYRAGASTVITKPSSVEKTNEKIKTFFSYWFKVAELPGHLVDA